MRNCFCYFKDGNKLKTSLIQGFCPLKTEIVRFLVRLVLKQRHLSSPSLRSLPSWLRLFLTFCFWSQIRELEVDLDNETRRGAEQQKICKKQERRIKDVLQQHEEDEKNVQHYKDQCDRLNKKVKTTKVNQEEAVCALSSPLSFSLFYSPSILTSHVCSLPFIPLDLHRQSFIVSPRYVSR